MGPQTESRQVDTGDGAGEAWEVSRARCGPRRYLFTGHRFLYRGFQRESRIAHRGTRGNGQEASPAQPAAPSVLPRTPRGPQSCTRAPTRPQDGPFFRARAPVTHRGPRDGRMVLRVPDWGAGRKATPCRAVSTAPRAHTLPPARGPTSRWVLAGRTGMVSSTVANSVLRARPTS